MAAATTSKIFSIMNQTQSCHASRTGAPNKEIFTSRQYRQEKFISGIKRKKQRSMFAPKSQEIFILVIPILFLQHCVDVCRRNGSHNTTRILNTNRNNRQTKTPPTLNLSMSKRESLVSRHNTVATTTSSPKVQLCPTVKENKPQILNV